MERLGRISRRYGVARYHQLYTYLRRALTDGAIRAGSALPSEAQLMTQYQVSRNTVRRALEVLQEERLIDRRHGSGTFARDPAASHGTMNYLSRLVHDGEKLKRETVTRILQFDFVPTPQHVIGRWPRFSARSLLVHRTRSHDGECFAITTSYVSDKVSRGLTRKRLSNGTVLSTLAAIGHEPVTGTQFIAAGSADVIMARHLNIPDGSPILRLEGITHDGEDEPLEYYIHVFRQDGFRLEMPLSYDRGASNNSTRWNALQPVILA